MSFTLIAFLRLFLPDIQYYMKSLYIHSLIFY